MVRAGVLRWSARTIRSRIARFANGYRCWGGLIVALDPFPAAMESLNRDTDSPAGYYRPFLALVPVTGVAVSTIGDLLGNETVATSNEQAMPLGERQFDLGEVPCWDAMNSAQPVLEPDLRSNPIRV